MTRSIIVINVDIRETRVALVEGGVIAELQIERAAHRGTVGNVVLGKVTRVLPGMQAAFIDVGQERSAFLHVEDLIRPDDFDLYLAGGADDGDQSFRGTGERKATQVSAEDEDEDEDDDAPIVHAPGVLNGARKAPIAVEHESVSDDEELVAKGGPSLPEADDDEDDEPVEDDASEDEHGEDDEDDAEHDDLEDADDDEDDEESGDVVTADLAHELAEAAVAAEEAGGIVAEEAVPLASGGLLAAGGEGHAAVALAPAEAVGFEGGRASVIPGRQESADGAAAVAPVQGRTRVRGEARGSALPTADVDSGGGRGRGPRQAPSGRGAGRRGQGGGTRGRRGRRGGHGNNNSGNGNNVNSSANSNSNEKKQFGGRRAVRGKGGGGRTTEGGTPPRVTRSVPITEVVKEGDEVVVQISKEPIGTKGARVTSHVSLPGRYVVYLPTVDHLGISKRIGSSRERARLRQVMESLKPARGGLIVRTVAEGLTKKQLKADVGYLIRVWAEVCKRRENARRAEVLYTELDLVLKVARDLFTDEVKSIVIDDREQYARLVRFVEMFLPERVKDIELYSGSEPIFDAYGIEDEIGRALSRKVPLPSGGSLIVDQAEALTAIDVNTGRYVGKGSKDLEETALKTNLEAVEEIAYQLRFRNIGGLVILDLIDMERAGNREKVWRALEAALSKDKAKTTLNRISELGLIEMTRKRTRESLGRMLHEPCFYCDGTGQIQSKSTIAYEILRQIGRERYSLPGYSVVVNAHPAIVDYLKTEDKGALDEAERRYARRIELAQRTEYHIEQYDLQGK
ncbi:MAG: hypothetical protein RL033_4367 [Pseudomonadota bacterium]|jgi:ribonuclease G